MKEFFNHKITLNLFLVLSLVVIVISTFLYGTYRYITDLSHAKNQLEITSKNLQNSIEELEKHIASTIFLNDFLTILKARNTDYQNEIDNIHIKVSQLEKLTSTDKELLQKYSKIYFLSENYIPFELSIINSSFLFRQTKPEQFHARAKPFLEALIQAARADGIDISVLSGYRSFGTQSTLKTQYKIIYGNGANKFSADQGYSEHQLGTTVDFTTKKSGESFTLFDKSPTYLWLKDNAHKFGFTLSYPENNSYYIFEPWHWRFVGIEFATSLFNEKKYFNDMPQRSIDAYLLKIFD